MGITVRRLTVWLQAYTLVTVLAIGDAVAGVFDVTISPPTFELKAKRSEKVREVFRITNNDSQTGKYLFRTADWDLSASGGVQFDEGQPVAGSCRPW